VLYRRCTTCGYRNDDADECPRCHGEAELSERFRAPEAGRGFFANFSTGLNYFFLGFSFLNEHRQLYRWVWIPLFINTLLFAAVFTGCFLLVDPLMEYLDQDFEFWLWNFLVGALFWIGWIVIIVVDILISLIVTLLLSTVINSPFYEILSEKVENIYLGGGFDEAWSWQYIVRNFLIPLRESIKLVCFELAVTLLLFVVSLFTGGLGSVLLVLGGVWFAALTFFDMVMARKGYTLAEKRRFMGANPGFALGFGTPVYFVPLIAPFAVVGATLGFLKAIAAAGVAPRRDK